jgi:hypothetical protein
MDRWMDWDGVVWGGQSTPGWKWRRIVYHPNTCTRDSSTASPIAMVMSFDLAVRLLSNHKSFLSIGTYTIGVNL